VSDKQTLSGQQSAVRKRWQIARQKETETEAATEMAIEAAE